MSALVLPSAASRTPVPTATYAVAEVDALRAQLRKAQQLLSAVEELRVRQAETATFYSAVDDHVRAAMLWNCESELRSALKR